MNCLLMLLERTVRRLLGIAVIRRSGKADMKCNYIMIKHWRHSMLLHYETIFAPSQQHAAVCDNIVGNRCHSAE